MKNAHVIAYRNARVADAQSRINHAEYDAEARIYATLKRMRVKKVTREIARAKNQ